MWNFRHAKTLSQGISYKYHVCTFASVRRLLEYQKKFAFRPIFVRWRSIQWRSPAILPFGATDLNLPLFSLHFKTAFFEAHLLSSLKFWQLWIPKCYRTSMEPPCTIVTPWYLSAPRDIPRQTSYIPRDIYYLFSSVFLNCFQVCFLTVFKCVS